MKENEIIITIKYCIYCNSVEKCKDYCRCDECLGRAPLS